MKRILLAIIYCLFSFYFINASKHSLNIIVNDDIQSDITIIEITDATLDRIYYSGTTFDTPTKLIFTNLTTINSSIYFSNTSNLVSVEFPLLETVTGDAEFLEFNSVSFHQNTSLENVEFPSLKSIYGHLYFHQNLNLKTANFTNLETVYSYVYFNGNSSLDSIEICNLKEILPQDEFDSPYYYFRENNDAVDSIQPCWGSNPPTDLTLSGNSINENENSDTLIGMISAEPDNPNYIYYFDINDFSNDQGEDYSNNLFKIVDNQLFSNASFDFEAKNEYLIKVSVRNNYGEKFSEEFTININDVNNETLEIIEITDTTLDRVYYSNTSFTNPTKLIFKNLTSINGDIFFYNSINIKEVEFPALQTINGHIYFDRNSSLTKSEFPKLTTIYDYIYVSRNNILIDFNICSLTEIIQSQSGIEPYYYIKNNPLLNYDSTCLTNTIITLNYLDNIVEESGKLLAATFSSNAGEEYSIKYFFIDDDGEEIINEDFEIIDNKLYLTKELNYYQDKEFSLKIGALRYENISATKYNSKKILTNGFNERIEETFSINVTGTTLSNDDLLLNSFKIYPNPTEGVLNIKQNDISVFQDIIEIYNSQGRKLKSIKPINDQINISSLSSGIYLMKYRTENGVIIKKIIRK